MSDVKEQRVDPAVQAIDDAIELFELFLDPWHSIYAEREKKSFELGITALRYMKGSLYEK